MKNRSHVQYDLRFFSCVTISVHMDEQKINTPISTLEQKQQIELDKAIADAQAMFVELIDVYMSLLPTEQVKNVAAYFVDATEQAVNELEVYNAYANAKSLLKEQKEASELAKKYGKNLSCIRAVNQSREIDFQPEISKWQCQYCGYKNIDGFKQCQQCGMLKN